MLVLEMCVEHERDVGVVSGSGTMMMREKTVEMVTTRE